MDLTRENAEDCTVWFVIFVFFPYHHTPRNGLKMCFGHPAVTQADAIEDAVSLQLLRRGPTVDFSTTLIGSSFHVANKP
jgi:hypothetical protein